MRNFRDNALNRDLLCANFSQQAWQSVHPLVKQWIPAEQIRSQLVAELEDAFHLTEDLQFATRFQKSCPIKGTTKSDYLHRVISLEAGGYVLAGIRFKGLNTAFPFVDVLACDFPLDSAKVLRHLIDGIREAFTVFSPQQVRIRFGSHEDGIPLESFHVTPDLSYFAAPVTFLQQQPHPKNYDAVCLERYTDTDFYPRYQVVHDKFRESSPTLADEILPSSLEDFRNCIANGYVYEVGVKGQWAGVIAVWRHSEYGMYGYCIQEEILASDFRGQGFGAAMLRHLIEHIEGDDHTLLFGHIHPKNVASLTTARRVGLIEVGGYFFIEL